jgi:hypothetical protein
MVRRSMNAKRSTIAGQNRDTSSLGHTVVVPLVRFTRPAPSIMNAEMLRQQGTCRFAVRSAPRLSSLSVKASAGPVAVDKSRDTTRKPNFPFVRIAGQEEMKLALCLNVVDPNIGGVLIMGDRGTGKSVAVRAACPRAEGLPAAGRVRQRTCAVLCGSTRWQRVGGASRMLTLSYPQMLRIVFQVRAVIDLLPAIDVVTGDPFNSDPYDPKLMGPDALMRFRKGEKLPVTRGKTPLVSGWHARQLSCRGILVCHAC